MNEGECGYKACKACVSPYKACMKVCKSRLKAGFYTLLTGFYCVITHFTYFLPYAEQNIKTGITTPIQENILNGSILKSMDKTGIDPLKKAALGKCITYVDYNERLEGMNE